MYFLNSYKNYYRSINSCVNRYKISAIKANLKSLGNVMETDSHL